MIAPLDELDDEEEVAVPPFDKKPLPNILLDLSVSLRIGDALFVTSITFYEYQAQTGAQNFYLKVNTIQIQKFVAHYSTFYIIYSYIQMLKYLLLPVTTPLLCESFLV